MDKLLTLEEVANYLQMSPKTIYGWTYTGYIPHFKVGGHLRFDPKEIRKWLAKRECKGRKRLNQINQYI